MFINQDMDKWLNKWGDANIQFQGKFAHLSLRVYIKVCMNEWVGCMHAICIDALLSKASKLHHLIKVARL